MNPTWNIRTYLLFPVLIFSLMCPSNVKGEEKSGSQVAHEQMLVLGLAGPKLEGLNNKEVEVNLSKLELSKAGEKLEDFLSLGTGATDDLNIQIYKISSEKPYWLDYMSSMGAKSRRGLLLWIGSSMFNEFKKNIEDVHFEESSSLLELFLGGAPKKDLIEGAKLWADFIGELLSPYESNAPIDRPVYSTSFKLCPFSHKQFSIILVDPTPHYGPEKHSYLIIIESIYSE